MRGKMIASRMFYWSHWRRRARSHGTTCGGRFRRTTAADRLGMLTQTSSRSAAPQFVAIASKGSIIRATLVGPSVDERASQIISREVNGAIAKMGKRLRALVLDMSQVNRMTSVGLGMCIDVRNSAHVVGAATYTVALNRELTDLFRMMRINRLITMVYDDAELAKLLR